MAVLVHELGHHATGATRAMLLVSWLTGPWRVARSLLTGLASILAGRQSGRGALIAVVVGLGVAVSRTLHQGQWMVGGVLAFVGLAAVLCPLIDAALSRRSESAADRFDADLGLAPQLAAALHALDDGRIRPAMVAADAGIPPDLRSANPRASRRGCRSARLSSMTGDPRYGMAPGCLHISEGGCPATETAGCAGV